MFLGHIDVHKLTLTLFIMTTLYDTPVRRYYKEHMIATVITLCNKTTMATRRTNPGAPLQINLALSRSISQWSSNQRTTGSSVRGNEPTTLWVPLCCWIGFVRCHVSPPDETCDPLALRLTRAQNHRIPTESTVPHREAARAAPSNRAMQDVDGSTREGTRVWMSHTCEMRDCACTPPYR